MRINSKQERAFILGILTRSLIESNCKDLMILTMVDKLCRRTWEDIHPGWIKWSYYLENLLGTKYKEFARANCLAISADVAQ